MNDNTLNLIKAISDGNAIETESAFNAAMAEKISAKLEDMRAEVARNMFAPEAVVEEETAPEEDEDEDEDEGEEDKEEDEEK